MSQLDHEVAGDIHGIRVALEKIAEILESLVPPVCEQEVDPEAQIKEVVAKIPGIPVDIYRGNPHG